MGVTLAAAHAVNDAYIAFLPPLLPRIMSKLGLSIALAATVAMTLSLAASALQPVVGYLSDRHGRRLFVAFGPLCTGLFLSLIGVAHGFWTLVVILIAGGFGSAAFHPPGASMAARVGEGEGSGARLSIFSFGGSLGYAAGPLIAVALVSTIGLEGMWIASLPAFVVATGVLLAVPAPVRRPAAAASLSPARVLARLRGALGLVFGISAIGAFIQRLFLTLEPIIVANDGGSEALGAVALSIYLAAQAAGTIAGGLLTDRVDRRHLLAAFTLFAIPAHLAAFSLPMGSPAAIGAIATAGFVNMALLPPVVVIAQEVLPEGAAATSGIVMGLAWATGSVGVIGAGILGDAIGPRAAALVCVPLLLGGTALAMHPALRAHRRPVLPSPELRRFGAN